MAMRQDREEVQMRSRAFQPSRRVPSGITLIGLLFWAILVGLVGYVAIRVLPTVNEYLTIQRAVNRVAAESPPTVAEVRKAFEKQKEIEYSIEAVSGKDLEVTKENEKLVIRFAYDKEVPLIEPVYLLIKYKGQSN